MKILHAPQHEGQFIATNLSFVKKMRPRSAGFTEMDYGRRDAIGLMRQYLPDAKICTAAIGSHSQEVPIAFREGPFTKVEKISVIKISDDLPGKGIGNDRYMTVVRFKRYGRRFAHIATHWDAVLQHRDTGLVLENSPRVLAMVQAAQMLVDQTKELISEGREVWITGDFNYRRYNSHQFKLWEHSPQQIFQELGMEWFESGLDYMAWTPGLKLRKPISVIEPNSRFNRSDHPWLLGRFRCPVLPKKK